MAAGDVVNTAARLQAAAPVGRRARRRARPTARPSARSSTASGTPVEAKGKAEPVPVGRRSRRARGSAWTSRRRRHAARRARARARAAGERARPRARRARAAARHAGRRPRDRQEPARLRALRGASSRSRELIYWRQGAACPTARAHVLGARRDGQGAGRHPRDGRRGRRRRRSCASAVDDLVDARRARLGRSRTCGRSSGWLGDAEARATARGGIRRLAPLLRGARGAAPARARLRGPALGRRRPARLRRPPRRLGAGVPLLVVCTARPELLERRPGWGGGKPNALTISLSPLSDEETARCSRRCSSTRCFRPSRRRAARARRRQPALRGGVRPDAARERATADDLPLPESVQGIIARGSTRSPPRRRRSLQDAAVIGKVFWLGAVAALGGATRRARASACTRSSARSSCAASATLVGRAARRVRFRHVLVRDVAYGQIPRAAASREAPSRGRVDRVAVGARDDQADLLAHHYVSALEYGAEGLGERAARALREAGDRARRAQCVRRRDPLLPSSSRARAR